MNHKSDDALLENVQACVDQLSGAALVAKFGDWWDARDLARSAAVQGDDHTIAELSGEDRQFWIDRLAPMTETFLADTETRGIGEARGLDDAREIFDAMKAAAAAAKGPCNRHAGGGGPARCSCRAGPDPLEAHMLTGGSDAPCCHCD